VAAIAALGDKVTATEVALPGEGAQVIVGLRPQNMTLSAQASPIRVDISERLGGVAYDYLSTPTGERLVVETRGDEVQPEGTEIVVDFDPATAMFFDAETEKRLR
jgi:lactose/L-arabinose transport system ATP-binding protein